MDTGSLRRALRAYGTYSLATGVAPFLSRAAFERVTGPKREWWLVQTVGGLATAVGAGVVLASRRPEPPAEVAVVAAGCAMTFAAIDVAYVARRRISPIYLADAVVQAAALVALAVPAWSSADCSAAA